MSAFLAGVQADLPGIFADLGQVVVYAPASGAPRNLTAIVGDRSEPLDLDTLTADGRQLWVRFIASAVPELRQGDGVTIGADAYKIDGIEYDRGGSVMATLINDT